MKKTLMLEKKIIMNFFREFQIPLKISAFITLLAFGLSSCIPSENPVTPHQRGDVKVGVAEMGNLYPNQIYFSLSSDSVVSVNNYLDWDIGFSCLQDNYAVILNTARFSRVLDTKKVKFEDVSQSDTAGVDETVWTHDNPAGKLDSTAIGTWWETVKISEVVSKSEVYIIDRGVNERGKATGYKKMQILGFENNSYFIRLSNLDGSGDTQLEIPINPNKNFIQVSFNDNGKIADLEPISINWDLCFTKYTDLLYTSEGDAMWYGVTGPLLNPKYCTALYIADSSRTFETIDYDYANSLTLSTNTNAIGIDWKTFDLGNGFYVIHTNMVYVIKTSYGFYKLHFVDFYNTSGEKGYPKFEFQKL